MSPRDVCCNQTSLSDVFLITNQWTVPSPFFLLDIFFLYISNAIPKAPYTLSRPAPPTHPLLLPGPGIALYWGI